jgi:hypothetical protein
LVCEHPEEFATGINFAVAPSPSNATGDPSEFLLSRF